MNTKCQKCGKPVYFAERKTSLGKNWHPNCLRCEECGKILTPGQHAERKGLPYCHKPCYAALFGPQMMGYGSNVVSPANYKRDSYDRTLHNGEYDFDPTMVYVSGSNDKSKSTNKQNRTSSDDKIIKTNNNAVPNGRASKLNDITSSLPLTKRQELLKKVTAYNSHYEGKKRQSLSTKEDNNNLIIEGPLRIYWGVLKPIQLQQYDNVQPTSQSNWRHSFVPGERLPDILDTTELKSPTKEQVSSPLTRGFDDSVIMSPPEGVVMRKKNIKKFNTVAYRGDSRPNKWKRASINGHTYDFETRVFTPVLGSCTSVTVDSTMNSTQVIFALLEKFKIENCPDEFSLCMVSEKEGDKTLRELDIPLLERVAVGPDGPSGFKIFLRDRVNESPTSSRFNLPVPEEVEEPKVEQSLPEEVSQLLDLPEPVLQGILRKFGDDEDRAVRNIKARYDTVKKRYKEVLRSKRGK